VGRPLGDYDLLLSRARHMVAGARLLARVHRPVQNATGTQRHHAPEHLERPTGRSTLIPAGRQKTQLVTRLGQAHVLPSTPTLFAVMQCRYAAVVHQQLARWPGFHATACRILVRLVFRRGATRPIRTGRIGISHPTAPSRRSSHLVRHRRPIRDRPIRDRPVHLHPIHVRRRAMVPVQGGPKQAPGRRSDLGRHLRLRR